MARDPALKSLILFLIFYTMFIPYGSKNSTKSQISAIADNLGCFYVANLSNGINFKTSFLYISLPQVNKVKMASTTTSKQLCLLLNLAKPALMAKLSASLFISSCGDIISNPGPSIESRKKSKCNIYE